MSHTKTLLTTGISAALAIGAYADTFTTGFEAPAYTVGSTLTGTNGWTSLANGFSAGTIQNTSVLSGSQAVTLTRPAGAPGTTGAIYTHSGMVSTPENPTAIVEWNMLALEGSQRSDVWGVSSMWGPFLERFTMGINADNKLIVRNGLIGTVVTGVSIARNQWNKYRMELNYQTDKADVFFNDAFVGQWSINAGIDEHTNTALFNQFGGNDGAIYDGLSVTAAVVAPVPEPTSLVAASVGLLALLRRKRAK